MRVEDIINDELIKNKIQEHINHTIGSSEDCQVTRFEYPEGSGNMWKITCEYSKDDTGQLTFKIIKRL
jgi:hypothetical protein